MTTSILTMLTTEQFNELPAGKIFACGFAMDGTAVFNITGKYQQLRWVAVKGYINDWAVYVGLPYWTIRETAEKGDKIHTEGYIRHVVPCVDEVYNRYRH